MIFHLDARYLGTWVPDRVEYTIVGSRSLELRRKATCNLKALVEIEADVEAEVLLPWFHLNPQLYQQMF